MNRQAVSDRCSGSIAVLSGIFEINATCFLAKVFFRAPVAAAGVVLTLQSDLLEYAEP